jgi:SdpI/YfhL protein family
MWIYDTSARLVIIAWVFTFLLLVLLLTCIAAGRGALRKNHGFGVRLPALMRSDSAWRFGHQAGVLPSAVTFVIAIVASVIGLAVPATYYLSIAAFVVGVIWVFARATSAAKNPAVTAT